MEPVRWIRGLVPLATIALVGGGAGAQPVALGALERPWIPPICTDAGPPGSRAPAWYRLDGMLDEGGTLAGQRLVTGTADGPERSILLPPESFASGPVGGVVLVGEDDGTRTLLSLLDVGLGCRMPVADERAVVRSALLERGGSATWEHRVDRATRADLGVWRRPLDGSAAVRRLAPAPADARYGRTFGTDLRFAPDGRVAVTSCGEMACRTRLLDGAAGRVTTIGPTGPVLGVTADGAVVAHARCPGFPCALLAHRADGGQRMLVPDAGRAAMTADRVVFEAAGGAVAVLDLASRTTTTLEGAPLVPLVDGSRARAGADRPAGSILLAPRGRLGEAGFILPAGGLLPATLEEALR